MSKPEYQWLKSVGQLSSMGLLVLISTLIGLGLGYYLDGKLGTAPWCAFALTVLGLASGIIESIKMIIKATRDEDDR